MGKILLYRTLGGLCHLFPRFVMYYFLLCKSFDINLVVNVLKITKLILHHDIIRLYIKMKVANTVQIPYVFDQLDS